MRPRVLHVAQPIDGGVAAVVSSLVEDQVSRGWRVVVACPSHGRLGADVVGAGARHLPWEASRGPGPATAGEALQLGALIRHAGPDAVHLHSSKAGLVGRAVLRGALPTVFQPHAWSFEAVDGLLRGAARGWERVAARWADRIVCVSHAERRAGERAGIRARYVVVPNGVDVGRFHAAGEPERSDARRRLRLGTGPLVVCVGRLCPQKGQDVLLRAWEEVRARVPDARLILVGDGPDANRLRAAAPASVALVADRRDVADWLAAANVVAAPSRWEGLPLAVLEAMARARPVVATAVGGMAEALGPEVGLVPPDDPARLATELVDLLLAPARARRQGEASRRRVESRFDLARSTAAVADVVAEVIAERVAHDGEGSLCAQPRRVPRPVRHDADDLRA